MRRKPPVSIRKESPVSYKIRQLEHLARYLEHLTRHYESSYLISTHRTSFSGEGMFSSRLLLPSSFPLCSSSSVRFLPKLLPLSLAAPPLLPLPSRLHTWPVKQYHGHRSYNTDSQYVYFINLCSTMEPLYNGHSLSSLWRSMVFKSVYNYCTK